MVVSRCLGVTQRKQDFLPQQQLKLQAPFFALQDAPEAPTRTSCEDGPSLCRAPRPPPSPGLSHAARSSPPAATPDRSPAPATPPASLVHSRPRSTQPQDPPSQGRS